MKRKGPSSKFVGKMPCRGGRQYAVYAVRASDVIASNERCDGTRINMTVGIRESKAKLC
jgi:hypothetical protein